MCEHDQIGMVLVQQAGLIFRIGRLIKKMFVWFYSPACCLPRLCKNINVIKTSCFERTRFDI